MSDEAHFHLGEYVNKQNCHIWGSGNLKMMIEKPLYPQHVTVWCSFWAGGIIEPNFFLNKAGAVVLVNGLRYQTLNFYPCGNNRHTCNFLKFLLFVFL